ncbi:MAG: protein kinase [Candidatus Wallbacteria bacterium]|nr:protein kinase [Candidatus Wallbacteria bacterium]
MEIGQLVGRFRVQKQIGRGGMGDVYLALDTMNFRNVALKVLPRVHQSSRVLIARFIREMEVCRRLNHPNIINMIDAGFDNDNYFMALEYIVGTSLDDLIGEKGQIDVPTAISYMQDISFALHAAHTQNIIHRDVKPGNVMLAKDGVIKLIDFGIAQSKDEDVHKRIRGEMDRLAIRFRESELSTSPGAIIGTPCYNSPEQNRGRSVDFSGDIYSLGLVFYEMFTGVQVLPNGPLPKILEFQATLDANLIPPSQLVGEIPGEIEQILLKMIRFNPEERFQNAGDLVSAFNRFISPPSAAGKDQSDAPGGKRLAQLELSETHYARAENFLAEKQYLEALGEFDSLLSLPVKATRYVEFIEKWMNFLVSVMRVTRKRRAEGEEISAFQVSFDEFVKIFSFICTIYGKMNLDKHRLLVEERLVDMLGSAENYEQVLATYDNLLNQFPDEPILQHGYAQFLFKSGAVSAAKRIQYEIINKKLDANHLEDALAELEAILTMDPTNSRAQQEYEVLSGEVAKRVEQVEAFFAEMRSLEGQRDPLWHIDTYNQFLLQFPGNMRALEKLYSLFLEIGQAVSARDTLAAMAVEDFFHKRPTAKDNFIKCLHADRNFTLAHVYLAEVYRREGTSFTKAANYTDLVVSLFSMVGMFEESLEEYTKRLRGSLDDIETYEKMIELLKRLGKREKLFEIYFDMGKCALAADRTDLAKEYFDLCIERAPDQTGVYTRLREVPNINKVYNLVKLRFTMLTQKGIPAPGEKDGKQTRGLNTFVESLRNRAARG